MAIFPDDHETPQPPPQISPPSPPSGSQQALPLFTSAGYIDHYPNPLFLSLGDNLSTPLIVVKLTNDNYHVWSRSLPVTLSIKNKLKFINSILPAPDLADSTYAAWSRCNFSVLNWIYNSVFEDIAQSLLAYDNAAHALADPKLRFSQADVIRIADLQARIASCDQGDISLTQYCTNIKVLWEEYLQHRLIPNCECAYLRTEMCAVVKRMMTYQDQDYVIRFIRGLNNSFYVVRSQLLLITPIPDINTAFKYAVQLERQMRGSGISRFIQT